MAKKVLIFSAPSGSGKSTIVNHILGLYPGSMEFSVSATSRAPRGEEQDGREYYRSTSRPMRATHIKHRSEEVQIHARMQKQ